MKSSILIGLLSLLFVTSDAQLTTYATAQDYLDKKGVQHDVDQFNNGMLSWGVRILNFSKAGDKKQKFKLKSSEVWAFEFKGHFFRIAEDYMVVMLIASGKICYWESGGNYLYKLSEGPLKEFSESASCYVSGAVDYPIKTMVTIYGSSLYFTSDYKSFATYYPDANEFYTCIAAIPTDKIEGALDSIRKCVNKYLKPAANSK